MKQGIYSAPKYLNNYASPTVKKWPEDIECIIKSSDPSRGSLYLSNVQAAQNPATVKKLNIGAILSCAKGYIISHPKSLVPHYMYIPGQDKQTFDISLHFDEAVQFINKVLEKTNIIVHCIAGVSRSVSMVIAYFMKHKRMTYNQAFYEVKSKRKIISPNQGFIKHLKKYEQKLKNIKQSGFIKRQTKYEQVNDEQNDTFLFKYQSKQYYTPKKSIQYYRNLQFSQNVKNPESNIKDQILANKNLQLQTTVKSSHRTNNIESINDYKRFSKSMTFLPEDNSKKLKCQQLYASYGSKNLSPRKYNNYFPQNTTAKTRQQLIYGKTSKGGYFDSMNKDLNQKIQEIRKKYEQQRSEMIQSYNSRGYSGDKKRTNNIYVERQIQKPIQRNYTNSDSFEKVFRNYQTVSPYERNLDLKYNSRLKNLDTLCIPRTTTNYGFSYAFGKKYY